ncbi:MAG: isocitrate lyase/phosphoenolpyruvate mutase family protein [Thermomicrobiales bacterium]
MGHGESVFRRLHEEPGIFVIPNPWDIGSARILANLGFKALATTSAGLAFSMGRAEGDVTPEEVLRHCKDIAGATSLPVSADLESGFGNSPESAAETIRAAAVTGLSGASLEDFSGNPEAPIYDFALAVERVHAAAEAARALPEDFVFTARCENLLYGLPDLDAVIRRLQAYEQAGADVLYAPGLRDLESIRTVCSSVSRPVNVVMGLPGAVFTVAELADAGVKRISVGAALARLAYTAVVDAAKAMHDPGSFAWAGGAMGFAPLEALVTGTGAPPAP